MKNRHPFPRPRDEKFAKWAGKWSIRISTHVPEPLLANPERVFLNFAAIVLGALALLPPPGTIVAQWSQLGQEVWGIGMIVAGVAALHGAWTNWRPTERFGALLFAIGAVVYGASAYTLGWRGSIVGTLFVLLGAGKFIRMVRSFAAEEYERRRTTLEE